MAENALNAYTFERRVDRRKPDGSSTPNWIDLYKRAHLVLETKQGVNPRRDICGQTTSFTDKRMKRAERHP